MRRRQRAQSAGEWRARHFTPAVSMHTAPRFDFAVALESSETNSSVALAYRLAPNGMGAFLALRPLQPLYPHQVTGAEFMLDRHLAGAGGGLCDDLRTGKTRAAIYAAVTAQQRAMSNSSPASRWGRPTLVVCPKDLLGVWQGEIEALYGPGKLAVLTLDTDSVRPRQSREALRAQLREGTDIVLTSISYLAESSHFGAAMLQEELAYRMLICDEAHEYVSAGTQSFEILCRMRADSKWYVTGTPIQNSLQSLTTALTFMGVHRTRLSGMNARALINLARTMTLRRTWILLEVMPRTPVPTSRPLEDRVYRAALRQLVSPKRGPVNSLKSIHILRQLVLSPYLCRDLYDDGTLVLPDGAFFAPVSDSVQDAMTLAVREMTMEDIGADAQQAWQIVPLEWRDRQDLRRQVDILKSTLIPRVAPKERWFINYLLRQRIEPTREKVVVFSGFRAPLQRLAKLLSLRREYGVRGACDFVLIDGDLSVADRTRLRGRFACDPNCQVLLATIDVNGRGLDLTHANHTVINDPWWNPNDEHQAVGRMKGPKQTRPVHTYRLVLPGTIDECVADEADAKVRLDQAALPQSLLVRPGEGPVEVSAVATEDLSEEPARERVRTSNVMDQLRAQARGFNFLS
jgi:SNF2 family DNA or RNA helicase